jgi:hypothetical protein
MAIRGTTQNTRVKCVPDQQARTPPAFWWRQMRALPLMRALAGSSHSGRPVHQKCVRDPAIWGTLRGDLRCQFRLTVQRCQSILTPMDVEDLNLNLSSDDPEIGLRASLALHRLAERVEANHVASARDKGWSWQQIGDALGVTRQSVHTKYNKESS